MTIHKEGRTLLFVLLVIFVGIGYASDLYLNNLITNIIIAALVIMYLLVLQFFRNPIFSINREENTILAPADGKVVVIEETTEDECIKERCIQLSIFMSPLNVHVNRTPAKGVVEYFKYHPGKYLVAWHPKSSTENERTTMLLKTAKGFNIVVRQIAGAVARRIKYYVKENQPLEQGEEFGFIKFGSRVDVFLPLGSEILVSEGEKTKGGRTVLAKLP